MKNEKFYICRTCGNLVNVINASGVPMMCCGKPMEALEPNTVEASGEKHIPAVTVEEGAVHVMIGSVEHPMVDVHYIEWVYLQTENGGQRINLKPNQEPKVTFLLGNEKPVAVYAYCNLHGLWKTEL
ncbi:MAG: desulfoferrodoxin [Lachnospiraceae bacterium]|jgi:superoxide reductase|nr:desulfoferrodoxin [Lachnospiraceae bacterium]MBQ2022095.1 desulfoferrodoxin [Lachnospiraceae bacterium]MBQ2400470.1 desulfoferrodoxin [Lachnospiraceae bacterium]MBQ2426617.1 desulfoferrodoxin [Lachnospiraceae bacterium]MBQ5659993.1 desulfoferrodoxin [Lachnospiraceae bacterium]